MTIILLIQSLMRFEYETTKKEFLHLNQQLHSYARNHIGVSGVWHQLKFKP